MSKSFSFAAFGLLLSSVAFAANPEKPATPAAPAAQEKQADSVFSNPTDKLSYTIGADMGQNFKKQDIAINPSVMQQGLNDALKGDKLKMTDEQMRETLQQFQKDLIAKRVAQFNSEADKNAKEGDQYLSSNKAKPGVKSTATGLQYKVIKDGSGKKPAATDAVQVEYTGQFINGKVFDKSEKPITLELNRVIPAWTEALQLMPEGSEWEIYVPAKLGYGNRGFGREIGPNQTLVFKIHLIKVQAAKNTDKNSATKTDMKKPS